MCAPSNNPPSFLRVTIRKYNPPVQCLKRSYRVFFLVLGVVQIEMHGKHTEIQTITLVGIFAFFSSITKSMFIKFKV